MLQHTDGEVKDDRLCGKEADIEERYEGPEKLLDR